MFFLIRFAIKFCFWMMLISLFIPMDSKDQPQGIAQPGPIEAFLAAQETISDLSDFCTRKPQACETGKAALSSAGVRANEVAKVGYEYLDTRFGQNTKKPGGQSTDATVVAAHSGAAEANQVDAIKAKLREMALREILEAAVRQREQANEVDDKTQTGTVAKK
ncbi:DUF5330 domain-containing protein [Phyllobacterium sp. LjRoot231]|uniref:DUF5330 domain-containing protein n=1 Tax=Phyllobacterium sp. LjRoot231 TaxID=3342289 RepID=UPI003ECF5F44